MNTEKEITTVVANEEVTATQEQKDRKESTKNPHLRTSRMPEDYRVDRFIKFNGKELF